MFLEDHICKYTEEEMQTMEKKIASSAEKLSYLQWVKVRTEKEAVQKKKRKVLLLTLSVVQAVVQELVRPLVVLL